jgi:hypothetical protein
VEHCSYPFQERPVQSFGNAVVLGRVVDGKLLRGAGRFQMHGESLAKVLATAVGVQSLDSSAVLGLAPGLEVLVGVERIAFLTQEMKVR